MVHAMELADDVLRLGESIAKCQRCGATARLDREICVRCSLDEALLDESELSHEQFLSGLQENNVPDQQWRLGNYEILSEIGRGGMGVIYRARQRHSQRIVAVKRVLGYHVDNREWMERFRREAQAAASLDHPNILPIYEVSEGEDGLPYFSMKWASGGSLRQAGPALAKEPRDCVRLIAKVARAVDYAHKEGILHRDLQPGNILLDGRGEPLVCDFGLAKWLDGTSDLTRTLTTFGTPGYIAPEQAEGPAADLKPTADIYSLGAILFNLLAKRPPFLGSNALSVIRQAAASEAPRLRVVMPHLDRDVETIVARCLERDPKARYQTAGDLAEDLERWLDARKIIARPVSHGARSWRWSRRNPVLAIALAICLGLAGVVAWMSHYRGASSAKMALPEKSIAVLPFENFTPGQENQLFGDVLQDDIITDLGRLADLKVISRSSVRDYKPGSPRDLRKIAAALGVRYLLEGSVRRTGDRFRINARLTDAPVATEIWVNEYEGNLSEIFATQGQIAQTIANQLQVQFSGAERAALTAAAEAKTNFQSYDLYLQAKELTAAAMSSKDAAATLQKAVLLLEEAARLDPAFLPAYCELVRVHGELYWNDMDRTPERLARTKEALDTAVRLAPDAAETHLARGRYDYISSRDFDHARSEVELAQKGLPNNSSLLTFAGLIDRRQNRWKEGLENLRRANELDPRNPETIRALADTYLELRQYPAMEQLLKRALTIVPQHALVLSAKLADCYLARGEPGNVLARFAGVPPNAGPSGFQAYYRFTAAFYLHDYDRARAAIAGTAFVPDSFKGPFCPPSWFEGLLARAEKNPEKANAAFAAAAQWAHSGWGDNPSDPTRLSIIGLINAGMGKREEAIRAAKDSVTMRSQDALDRPMLIANLALVYSWLGDKDLALEKLATVAKGPAGPSFGDLHLNPRWNELRGDERFEALVDALRPQAGAKPAN
jgi:serine/threonine protein kinase/tetratricopeptide (TPR) repeat protein